MFSRYPSRVFFYQHRLPHGKSVGIERAHRPIVSQDGCHGIRRVNSLGAAMRNAVRGPVSTSSVLRDIRPTQLPKLGYHRISQDAPPCVVCHLDRAKIYEDCLVSTLILLLHFRMKSEDEPLASPFFLANRGVVGFPVSRVARPMLRTRATPAGHQRSAATRPASPSSVGTATVSWKPRPPR